MTYFLYLLTLSPLGFKIECILTGIRKNPPSSTNIKIFYQILQSTFS